jgi:hypothetical protein
MQVFRDGMELQWLQVEVQHLECEVTDAQVHITELEATDGNGNDEAEVKNEEDEEADTDIAVRSLMFGNPAELHAQTHRATSTTGSVVNTPTPIPASAPSPATLLTSQLPMAAVLLTPPACWFRCFSGPQHFGSPEHFGGTQHFNNIPAFSCSPI